MSPGPAVQGAPPALSRPVALVASLLCFICGAAVLAVAIGVLPAQPGTLEAPRWVAGCAGVIFMAGALIPLNAAFGLPDWMNQLAALSVALGLAVLFNWVAFFPGERHFSTTFSVPGVQVSTGGGQIMGRIMFGLGALLADAIVLHALWRALRPGAAARESRLKTRDSRGLRAARQRTDPQTTRPGRTARFFRALHYLAGSKARS